MTKQEYRQLIRNADIDLSVALEAIAEEVTEVYDGDSGKIAAHHIEVAICVLSGANEQEIEVIESGETNATGSGKPN